MWKNFETTFVFKSKTSMKSLGNLYLNPSGNQIILNCKTFFFNYSEREREREREKKKNQLSIVF
jgi:hypothetical protein